MNLGPFELLVRIGKGGMASVWVARGQLPGDSEKRIVAVKAMLPELVSDAGFRAMFLQEGQLIQSIQHNHVVKVLGVGEANGILYMGMEWVEGDSLHALIAEANKRRPIPPEMAVRLIADTAAGLHAAHELRDAEGNSRGVVHCDVSPQNILVGINGVVKLVDFGVASAVHQLAQPGKKLQGKFSYMSPEQSRTQALDRRSDLFSLGIVLFELTTGYRLFRGESPSHSLELVRSGPIVPPRQLRPDYPAQLEAIVLKALERDPRQRFQTAKEFQEALENYLLTERILVPEAGVGALLRRVLGKKLNEQRRKIREAALSLEDGARTQWLPDAAEISSPDAAPEPESVSGTLEALAARTPQTHRPPPQPAESRRWGLYATLLVLLGTVVLFSSDWLLPAGTLTSGADALTAAAPLATSERPSRPAGPSSSSPPALVTSARPKPEAEPTVEAHAVEALPLVTAPQSTATLAPTRGPSAAETAWANEQRTLARASANAATCGSKIGPAGRGSARLSVSSSGTVVLVQLGPPFAGHAVGSCVRSKFEGLKLRPGSPRTLNRKFSIKPR